MTGRRLDEWTKDKVMDVLRDDKGVKEERGNRREDEGTKDQYKVCKAEASKTFLSCRLKSIMVLFLFCFLLRDPEGVMCVCMHVLGCVPDLTHVYMYVIIYVTVQNFEQVA